LFLSKEIVKALGAPETHERLVNEGAIPVGSSPDEAARFVTGEIARWGQVTKTLGLRID
jgi:tripartite-type tricarboxylate transporter receptor subunit TctC